MIEFISLSVEKDKDGSNFEVKKIDKLSYTPVYTFFLRQQAELIDAGLSYPYTSWNDSSCGAIYAERNGEVIGLIVFDRKKYPESLWIVLSSVDKKFRKLGIYKALHRHLESVALDIGCHYVCSHVHVNNHTRLKSAEIVGMKPIFYFMAKKLNYE